MVSFRKKSISCYEALDLPAPQKPNKKIVHVVAAALVDQDRRILVTQRPEGKKMAGMWEFPGGKIDEGETPEYALMRELDEELGLTTRPCCFSPIAFASHGYDDFHLMMPLFICRVWKGLPQSREGQAMKWVQPMALYDLEMPEADLPLIDELISHLDHT